MNKCCDDDDDLTCDCTIEPHSLFVCLCMCVCHPLLAQKKMSVRAHGNCEEGCVKEEVLSGKSSVFIR